MFLSALVVHFGLFANGQNGGMSEGRAFTVASMHSWPIQLCLLSPEGVALGRSPSMMHIIAPKCKHRACRGQSSLFLKVSYLEEAEEQARAPDSARMMTEEPSTTQASIQLEYQFGKQR